MKSKPEPNRWYLYSLESVDYCMREIRKGLDMDSIEPKPNFRSVYRITQHLEQLIRIAAIREERDYVGYPIIKYPHD